MTDQSCKCERPPERCICFSHPSFDAPPAINRPLPLPDSTASARAIIEAARRDRAGYLKDTEVAAIATDPATRLQLLLVRCGGGRFIAPAQDVAHFIAIIERDAEANRMNSYRQTDYVRDVSIYSPHEATA